MPPVAGDAIIVAFNFDQASDPSVSGLTDSAGNTYHRAIFTPNVNNESESDIWYAGDIEPGDGGPLQVTATFTSKSSGVIFAYEFTGLATTRSSGLLDQSSGSTGDSGASFSSGPITTMTARELLFAFARSDHGVTTASFASQDGSVPSPESTSDLQSGTQAEFAVVSAQGTYSATFTNQDSADTWTALIASFRGAD